MWLDVTTFRSLTGLTTIQITDEQITEALQYASAKIRELVFVKEEYKTYKQSGEHLLEFDGMYPVSLNDDVIDVQDINVYEVDKDNKRYDLSSYLSMYDAESGWVTFSTAVPTTAGRMLVIEYWLGKFRWSEEYQMLRDLQRWMALKLLFENIPFEQLQEGVSSWSLNGVSVNDGSSSISNILRDIDDKVARKIRFLQPFFMRGYR